MKYFIITAIITLIEIFIIIALFMIPSISVYLISLLYILSILIALILLNDTKKTTTSRLTWIFVVLAIPMFGVILYLVFGKGAMFEYRNRIYSKNKRTYTNIKETSNLYEELDSRQLGIVNYLKKVDQTRLHRGGTIKTFTNGKDKLDALVADIKQAKAFIHIEYFILKPSEMWDQIEAALLEVAKNGVEVRIIADYKGSFMFDKNRIKFLEENNIYFKFFNKPRFTLFTKTMNYLDHRKAVIIDGKIAYTGGFNIGNEYMDLDPYFKHWQDFHMRLENSEAIKEYETYFAQTWYYMTQENLFEDKYYPTYLGTSKSLIYVFGDGPDSEETYVKDMFFKLIMAAKKKIVIVTPYLIPDTDIYNALVVQANSGIDITIITPGLPDKRYVKFVTESYYPELTQLGVKIFEYETFIHAKKVLVDDDIAMVGTANLDMRSFNLSFELCTVIFNGEFIQEIAKTIENDLSNSRYIPLEKEPRTPKKLLRIIMNLFVPLF